MARDPRGNSAFSSGLRGREKPKVADAHGKTWGQEDEGKSEQVDGGGVTKQGPDRFVGNPDGVNLNDSAYSSGMRGMETAKQKSAGGDPGGSSGANMFAEKGSPRQPENKQLPNSVVGQPSGEQSWSGSDRGPKKGVGDEHLRGKASDAYELGNDGNAVNSSEQAAEGHVHSDGEGILGEEDDTHINIRIPKASLKKKNPGLQTS